MHIYIYIYVQDATHELFCGLPAYIGHMESYRPRPGNADYCQRLCTAMLCCVDQADTCDTIIKTSECPVLSHSLILRNISAKLCSLLCTNADKGQISLPYINVWGRIYWYFVVDVILFSHTVISILILVVLKLKTNQAIWVCYRCHRRPTWNTLRVGHALLYTKWSKNILEVLLHGKDRRRTRPITEYTGKCR